MNTVLEQRVDALSRLALTIRTGLAQAERAVPPINELLAELAEMGVCNFEYEGPAVYCRPHAAGRHWGGPVELVRIQRTRGALLQRAD